jgi:hypothetical protein
MGKATGFMQKIKEWARKKAAMISLSLSNVEKNAFGQGGEALNSDVNQLQRHTKGQLADSLVNGEITQEVMNLRWRTYKILRESDGYISEITGYDEDGMPIVKTSKVDKKKGLSKITTEPTDEYPLEIVLDNEQITTGVNSTFGNEYINVTESPIMNMDNLGNITGATHGTISGTEYFATSKTEKPIVITREFFPKFNIENYTKKLHVKSINKTEKLLEFYISKYPDGDNRRSYLFINELKKAINNPMLTSLFEIKDVSFTTYKTIGCDDFLYYEYEIVSLDKIVEYNEFYVVKFKANITVEAEDILEQHRIAELDKKYENKEKKK